MNISNAKQVPIGMVCAGIAVIFLWLTPADAEDMKIEPGEKVTKQISLPKQGEALINYGMIEYPRMGAAVKVGQGANKVFNYGTILMLNKGAIAIEVKKADTTDTVIVNEGEISTSDNNSFGIRSYRSGVTIRNSRSGSIVTKSTKVRSVAIGVKADKNHIVNQGVINTAKGRAIDIHGNDTKIESSGEMSTSWKGAHVIEAHGNRLDIDNSGTIRSSGRGALAIRVDGSDARIHNARDGKIIADHYEAIYVQGQSAFIINDGKIAANATAIVFRYRDKDYQDAGQTAAAYAIINNGTIDTRVVNGDGIFSYGSYGLIENHGAIVTKGDAAQTIEVHGNGNRIVNSGTLETHGATCVDDEDCGGGPYHKESAHGIWVEGSGNTIVNSGVIRTSGQNTHGIAVEKTAARKMNTNGGAQVSSSGATKIVNSGVIRVSGKGSYGIEVQNDHARIINKGEIDGGYGGGAIHARGHDNTLVLTPESRTSGRLTFDHPEDAHLQIDSQGSGSWEINGMPPIDAISSVNPAAISSGRLTQIAAEDLLSQAPGGAAALAGTVSAVIDRRLDASRRPSFSRVAGDDHRRPAHSGWIAPFGRRLRGKDFSHVFGGMSAGRDRALASGRGRVGFLGGFSSGRTHPRKGPRSSIGSVFAGLYRENAASFTDLSLVGGYSNASEKIRGLSAGPLSFRSDTLWINPSVRVYNDFALGSGMLTPSIGASYFGLVQLGGAEICRNARGTGLAVTHRSLQELDIGGRLRYDLTSSIRGGQMLEVGVEAGVDAILPLGDRVRVEGNVKSASFSPDAKAIVQEHLGAGVALDFRDGARLSAGLGIGYASSRTLSQTTFLKLTWSF